MKFEIPKCPKCGLEVRGIVEQVQGCAEVSLQDDGETYEYDGSTDIWWDEQRPVPHASGRVTLICSKAHEWLSKVTEGGDEILGKSDARQKETERATTRRGRGGKRR